MMMSFRISKKGVSMCTGNILKSVRCFETQAADDKIASALRNYLEARSGGELITSSSNTNLKTMKMLQNKKGRERTGLIRLDGHRTVIDALNKGFDPQHVVISTKALNAPLGQELLIALTKSLN